MQAVSFDEVLELILAKDTRYRRDAYYFLKDALDIAQKRSGKSTAGQRHVSGQELLEGIREHGLKEFGPMATTVFEEWGIRSCEDFGEMVFILIEHAVLRKTERDSRADFADGYDFYEAFERPFLPTVKAAAKLELPSGTQA